MKGDFTTVASPQCNTSGARINLPAPFNNNRIDPSAFSALGGQYCEAPWISQHHESLRPGSIWPEDRRNQFDSLARIDLPKSEKNFLFLRYLQARLDRPSDPDPNNLLSGSTANLNFRTQSVVLGNTYLIGTGTVSSFRATLNRSAVPKINPQVFSPSSVGINIWDGVPGLTRIAMTTPATGSTSPPITRLPALTTRRISNLPRMSPVRGATRSGSERLHPRLPQRLLGAQRLRSFHF